MSLNVSKRVVADGAVVILDCKGQLSVGEGIAVFRNALGKTRGSDQILINLTGVTNIDYSGLTQLVSASTETSKRGGQFKLLDITNHLQVLHQLSKLNRVFEIYEDEDEAVRSFGG